MAVTVVEIEVKSLYSELSPRHRVRRSRVVCRDRGLGDIDVQAGTYPHMHHLLEHPSS
jgi:hypothetical protein